MTAPASKLGKCVDVVVWMVALALLWQVVVLLRENRRLRDALAPEIVAQTELSDLSALDLDGRSKPLVLPGARGRLLIVTFSSGCPFCRANQERWNELAAVLEKKGVRTSWVSRDSVEVARAYCLEHHIPLANAFADPNHWTYLQLGLTRVPNTVLVGPGGKVEKVWTGRLDDARLTEILDYAGTPQDVASLQ